MHRLKNSALAWGPVSQGLHWLVVALILVQAAGGLLMVEMANSPDKFRLYALHKSIGLTVLALALIRLAWRLAAGTPTPLAGTPRWQRRAATLSHTALYALLLAIPLTGWLFNGAAGFPLQWFGLIHLPALTTPDPQLRQIAGWLHTGLFWLLALLAALHAAAAVYHHRWRRDATLSRMLPAGWLTPRPPATRSPPDA